MKPYFLDKQLKYKSRITKEFYLFVQPISSDHNFVGKGGTVGSTTLKCERKAQL